MIFLASWYEAERIHSFFFWGRYYFVIYFTDFVDVKFGLSCLMREDKAGGEGGGCWMRNVFLLQSVN